MKTPATSRRFCSRLFTPVPPPPPPPCSLERDLGNNISIAEEQRRARARDFKDLLFRARRNSGINEAPFGVYIDQRDLLLKRDFFRRYDREAGFAGVFPIPFDEAATSGRNAGQCDKKRIKYLPLDRTTRLMKIPIVTFWVLR